MKVRNLVSKRYKETPADCQIASQALMIRGGYIKPVGNGIFTLLPITKRITSKIENIITVVQDNQQENESTLNEFGRFASDNAMLFNDLYSFAYQLKAIFEDLK